MASNKRKGLTEPERVSKRQRLEREQDINAPAPTSTPISADQAILESAAPTQLTLPSHVLQCIFNHLPRFYEAVHFAENVENIRNLASFILSAPQWQQALFGRCDGLWRQLFRYHHTAVKRNERRIAGRLNPAQRLRVATPTRESFYSEERLSQKSKDVLSEVLKSLDITEKKRYGVMLYNDVLAKLSVNATLSDEQKVGYNEIITKQKHKDEIIRVEGSRGKEEVMLKRLIHFLDDSKSRKAVKLCRACLERREEEDCRQNGILLCYTCLCCLSPRDDHRSTKDLALLPAVLQFQISIHQLHHPGGRILIGDVRVVSKAAIFSAVEGPALMRQGSTSLIPCVATNETLQLIGSVYKLEITEVESMLQHKQTVTTYLTQQATRALKMATMLLGDAYLTNVHIMGCNKVKRRTRGPDGLPLRPVCMKYSCVEWLREAFSWAHGQPFDQTAAVSAEY